MRRTLLALTLAAAGLARTAAAPVAKMPADGASHAPALAVPTGTELLSRARTLAVPMADLAQAVAGAQTLDGLARDLERLNLLKPGEFKAGEAGGELALRDAVQTLWGEAARHAAPAGAWESAWPVPALVVQADGRSYYIHSQAHGLSGLNRRGVRSLARQLEAEGRPLIVEQDFHPVYGLRYGREVVDDPQNRLSRWSAASQRALLPFGRRFYGWLLKAAAWHYERHGSADLGRFYRAAAAAFSQGSEALYRSLELPLPLKESLFPAVVRRSRALADAARAAEGPAVHVLTSWSHVYDVAWLLGRRA